ncbi:protein of unknown function [Bradyrhizobium vignae]|uniref:Uncharacterized protein n=1 Tax=Bradyrhizobium vignae TaxID=1549949 RepID=A0A2U3PVU2_9BRAD|nr:protein of unknown function [Bradyrhizobium vignae]
MGDLARRGQALRPRLLIARRVTTASTRPTYGLGNRFDGNNVNTLDIACRRYVACAQSLRDELTRFVVWSGPLKLLGFVTVTRSSIPQTRKFSLVAWAELPGIDQC